MFMSNEAFSIISSLSETKESALCQISVYVAFEENIAIIEAIDAIKEKSCIKYFLQAFHKI